MTIDDVLTEAAQEIASSHDVALWRRYMARSDAEEMVAAVLGRDKITSRMLDDELSPNQVRAFGKLLKRRLRGEPIPLIVGHMVFDGMRVHVAPGVFVPRNSSELLAKEAIRRVRGRTGAVAVDVATGAGPVALTVARRAPRARVFGIDISKKAVEVADKNGRRLKLDNVRFLRSDLLKSLPVELRQRVEVFTIHPPYVRKRETADLPTEIREFEPSHALNDGSSDGLGLVRLLAKQGPDWLRPGGWILTEVSPDRSLDVRRVMRAAGYGEIRSLRDSVGATRVITARL